MVQSINDIRILLVDDNTETRESLKKLLAFEPDFKVIGSASNGRAGVEQAKVLHPDVIIMDANMPEMDGFEATSLILKDNPEAYVIMMSIQNGDDIMTRVLCFGLFGVI
jgi:pilus assembly protein CpaE